MIASWQEQRCKLNHDWLVGTFLNRLGAFLSRLRRDDIEPGELRRFLVEDWGSWIRQAKTAEALLGEFEKEMSPRALLDYLPLRHLPVQTRAWLGETAHELWRARTAAGRLVEAGRTRLTATNLIFQEISGELGDPENMNLSALPSLLHSFERFLEACSQFSRAFSALPGKVRVV